jgi:hypothetical protein
MKIHKEKKYISGFLNKKFISKYICFPLIPKSILQTKILMLLTIVAK